VVGSWGQKLGILNATWATCWSPSSFFAAILYLHKGVWPRSRLQSRAGKSVCKDGKYPLPLYVLRLYSKTCTWVLIICKTWPLIKSNAGSPDVERCKHVKSQATTTMYFS
jgi:hypothetical protein